MAKTNALIVIGVSHWYFIDLYRWRFCLQLLLWRETMYSLSHENIPLLLKIFTTWMEFSFKNFTVIYTCRVTCYKHFITVHKIVDLHSKLNICKTWTKCELYLTHKPYKDGACEILYFFFAATDTFTIDNKTTTSTLTPVSLQPTLITNK